MSATASHLSAYEQENALRARGIRAECHYDGIDTVVVRLSWNDLDRLIDEHLTEDDIADRLSDAQSEAEEVGHEEGAETEREEWLARLSGLRNALDSEDDTLILDQAKKLVLP